MFLDDPYDIWSFVYFIQVDSGPIKIGITDNIEKRKSELQTANHEKLIVLHYTTGGRALEQHLHVKFEKYNKLGEWFWPDEEILNLVSEFKLEDECYGRVDSIVQFALNMSFGLDKNSWETLVALSRGAVLRTSQIDEKLFYWKILDSYQKYLKQFPLTMVRKRRLSIWRNEGNQPWDAEIKSSLAGHLYKFRHTI